MNWQLIFAPVGGFIFSSTMMLLQINGLGKNGQRPHEKSKRAIYKISSLAAFGFLTLTIFFLREK